MSIIKTAVGIQDHDWDAIRKELGVAHSHLQIASEIAGRLKAATPLREPRKQRVIGQLEGRIHRIGTQLRALTSYMTREK